MANDPTIHEEAFPYFVTEASDLLQKIEADLLALVDGRDSAKVHALMRSAHTLKGAAATVGLETVKHVAHVLEDVFRALYNPDIEIDEEVEALLFEGYECLRMPLMAELSGGHVDESDILNRAAAIIARLQEKLGDLFDREAPIPTSQELGFDVVQSMFEMGVEQRLNALNSALDQNRAQSLADQTLRDQLETTTQVFLGLAESLQLPGFGAIAQTVLEAIATQPQRIAEITYLAYTDFRAGQQLILQGDRQQGGSPSAEWIALLSTSNSSSSPVPPVGLASVGLASVGLTPLPSLEAIAPLPNLDSLNLGLGTLTEATSDFTSDFTSDSTNTHGSETLETTETTETTEGNLSNVFLELGAVLGGLDSLANLDGEVNVEGVNRLELAPAAELEAGDGLAGDGLAGDGLISLDSLFGSISINSTTDTVTDTVGSGLEEGDLNPKPTHDALELGEAKGDLAALTAPQSQTLTSLDQLFSTVATPPTPASPPTLATPSPALNNPSSSRPGTPTPDAPTGPETPARPTLALRLDAGKARPGDQLSGGPSRETTASLRIGLDKVERLDHVVGEILTNQIQSSDQDDQLRLGIQELLGQLRQHRHTLSDLQTCAQQMGIDEWGITRNRQSASISQATPGFTPNVPLSPNRVSQSPVDFEAMQFDAIEMDRYTDLHILTQKALNQAVQLEIVMETVDHMVKQSRRIRDLRQRLFNQLRDDLASVRLQPIGDLLNRFPRVLRQLSVSQGKAVNLDLQGQTVLVDRAILEQLYDALLHLVRNAFDHGIEPSEERTAQNKSATGRITIQAYQQSNRTVIEVRDDGRGINLERVARKAMDLGLLDPAQAGEISEETLLEMLFQPGFSTASQLTELSGRGVGLDVVRSQIEQLNGSLSLQSSPGLGTTFTLRLPLSMTITKLLICRSGQMSYAIAADTIDQVLLPRPHQLCDLGDGRRGLRVKVAQEDKEQLIPLENLTELLPYDQVLPELNLPQRPGSNAHPVLMLRTGPGEGRIALQVDHVLGEQELAIRPLHPVITAPAYVQGCTILGDMQLALVIDTEQLLTKLGHDSAGRSSRLRVARLGGSGSSGGAIAANTSVPASPKVLLIDDSLTQRRTVEQTFARAGYRTVQAEDGLDALAALRQNTDVRLIVCDLEMPRMNGFEFVSQVRRIAEWVQVPIVILTSRSGAKYRQLALELGASAFLSKPYGDRELLQTAADLLQSATPLLTPG